MDKPWKVILAFLGIFAAGIVSGTLLGARYGHQLFPRSRSPESQNFSARMMERLGSELALTPEQTARIRPIVERTQGDLQNLRRDYMQQVTHVMDEMHSQIGAILTPEQRQKLEELRKRFRERSERIRREYRGSEPPK
ncbi:MAG: hypothetical protein JWM88_1974 [Verrucomicrobia bacterium]|nr:hypothetical protein [Verrucomicrobiota bacterium]